jgi:dCMP deaminase
MSASRPTWDEYFMRITEEVAKRATCLRRQVGAIIVRDHRILATGYNGAPKNLQHCAETGCLRERLGIPAGERMEVCRGLHAEQSAIVQAAVYGVPIAGGDLYATHQPCITCAKMLLNAGIGRIVFKESYPDALAESMLQQAGIETVRFSDE